MPFSEILIFAGKDQWTVLYKIKSFESGGYVSILLPYLVQLQKSGVDTREIVRRRTIRLQHLLNCAIIRGIRAGEFKKINIKASYELLYGLIESAIFKIAVLNQSDISDIYSALKLAIEGFSL